MTRNGKLMTAAGAVIAVVLAPVAALAGTNAPSASPHPVIIHVVEHAITDTVQQFHPPNNSLGDVLGFHNPVYNAANTRQVEPPRVRWRLRGFGFRNDYSVALTH